MAGVVVGFECPFCGYDGTVPEAPTIMSQMHVFAGTPIAMDLRCGQCAYEWRDFSVSEE